MPLCSHSLSRVVDDACFSVLLDSAPDVHSRALALSSAILHAGDWLNVIPSSSLGLHLLDCEFRPCLQYWLGFGCLRTGSSAQFAMLWRIPFGITMLIVEATGTESFDTMPSEMQSSQQLSLQLLRLGGRCLP